MNPAALRTLQLSKDHETSMLRLEVAPQKDLSWLCPSTDIGDPSGFRPIWEKKVDFSNVYLYISFLSCFLAHGTAGLAVAGLQSSLLPTLRLLFRGCSSLCFRSRRFGTFLWPCFRLNLRKVDLHSVHLVRELEAVLLNQPRNVRKGGLVPRILAGLNLLPFANCLVVLAQLTLDGTVRRSRFVLFS